MRPHVSDHALVRFLELAGGADIEGLRAALEASLARAFESARTMGNGDFLIQVGGLTYVVRDDTVTTVMDRPSLHARHHALGRKGRRK